MNKAEVIEFLDKSGVKYEITEHAPVFTIEEMLAANLPYPEAVAKNLFVRDDKKKNYYLISVKEERVVNLKEFQAQFGTRKLSFASENDLMNILKLIKGSVTPFGLLNDEECKVKFFIDKDYAGHIIGIHPNENTATLWIGYEDVIKIVKEHGNEVIEF